VLSSFEKELLDSNILGIKSLEELYEAERNITDIRQLELRKNGIEGKFDYQHLKDIHHTLFKDIYSWSGMDRYDVGNHKVFRKGNTYFTRAEQLPNVAQILFTSLATENYFKGLDENSTISSLASFLNGINILHPFREGNGRTQRLFMEDLAKHLGYSLNLSNISQSVMIQASIQGYKGNLKGYEFIIQKNIKKDLLGQ